MCAVVYLDVIHRLNVYLMDKYRMYLMHWIALKQVVLF